MEKKRIFTLLSTYCLCEFR